MGVGVNMGQCRSSQSLQGRRRSRNSRATKLPTFTYAYIDTNDETITSSHFIGVGIDGRAELRVPLGKKNSLGIGWASHVYIPQSMLAGSDDGDVFLDPSNWHVGQGFVKYYYRFPYHYRP